MRQQPKDTDTRKEHKGAQKEASQHHEQLPGPHAQGVVEGLKVCEGEGGAGCGVATIHPQPFCIPDLQTHTHTHTHTPWRKHTCMHAWRHS
jgi:hypothetical protein